MELRLIKRKRYGEGATFSGRQRKPENFPSDFEKALIRAAEEVQLKHGLRPFVEDHYDYYKALQAVREGSDPVKVAILYSPLPNFENGHDGDSHQNLEIWDGPIMENREKVRETYSRYTSSDGISDLYRQKDELIELRSKRRKKPYREDEREAILAFITRKRSHKEERDRQQRGVKFAKPHDSKKDGWPNYFRDKTEMTIQPDIPYFDGVETRTDYGGLKEKVRMYGSLVAYARYLGIPNDVLGLLPLERAIKIQEKLEEETFSITDILKLGQPILGERSGKLYIVSGEVEAIIGQEQLMPDDFFAFDRKNEFLHIPYRDIFTYVAPKRDGIPMEGLEGMTLKTIPMRDARQIRPRSLISH